jgi:hypothetical protein
MSSRETLSFLPKLRLPSTILLLFIGPAIFTYGQDSRCPKDESGAFTNAESVLDAPHRGIQELRIEYCAITRQAGEELGDELTSGSAWPKAPALAPIFLTKSDIAIGDLFVPAGKYSLYFLPSQNGWKLIVSKQNSGTEYDDTKDLGRVVMTTDPVPGMPADKLSILLRAISGKTCSGRCEPKNGPYISAKELGLPQIHFVWGTSAAYATIRQAKNPENALLR